MRVRFWGTRGSLPRPSQHTLRFGGNTSCVEVRTAAGALIIIDCGTGIFGLGQALMAAGQARLKGHILVSHTHWDHIQGIPFFAPFFVPENEWEIYAPKGFGKSLHETLAGQMQYAYFPVRLDEMGSKIRYHELVEGKFEIDDVTITTRYLNHTALTLGFRLESDGVTLVYASDHEPFSRDLASGCGELKGQDKQHCEFLAGADLVIHDAQFTLKEYATKIGWGHSTVEYAIAMCRAGQAARLALTHHDPLRTDNEIDQIISHHRDAQPNTTPALDLFAAAEGQTLELQPNPNASPHRKTKVTAEIAETRALVRPVLLMAIEDPPVSNLLKEAAESDDISVLQAGTAAEALDIAQAIQPALIVVGSNGGSPNHCSFREVLRVRDDPRTENIPIMVVADEEDPLARSGAPDLEWLFKPFSTAYARTRIRAALLRIACRWERSLKTHDEERRLAALHDLHILDTPAEERFDRITRLAASLFKVPMALISLVDRERQWFKSALGVDLSETSRETSFCAHAISSREVLVVPDTFEDPRFADYPLVAKPPRIRFYAGCPIFVGGHCIGTVCVLDDRPRQIDIEAVALLRDLAALAEAELARSHTLK